MGFNDDRLDSRFAWFNAISSTTTPIFANVSMMGSKDKDQQNVSENASRLMILMNVAQALGLMDYDFFEKRADFDKLPQDKKAEILKRGKMYVEEDYEKKSLGFLFHLQAKVQREANIAPTYDQKTHSIFQEFRVWKTNKGLIEK